jgi:hypothetical protein
MGIQGRVKPDSAKESRISPIKTVSTRAEGIDFDEILV